VKFDQQRADLHSMLPHHDYVSPGLETIMPDAAFPNMIVGDVSVPRWRYLRRWVEHNWYTDRRNPDAGFINRDEASILYNNALLFRGKPCLEIGCWRGWSTVHLALGSGMVDSVDPVFADPDFADSITASCKAAGVLDRVSFYSGSSPGAIDGLAQSTGKRWSLVFIDGDHENDAPRLDAEAAMRYATETAMVLFHDLASPYVAAGLNAMRNAGWRTMVYQTMQIMGVAWRGNVEPVTHVPDPKVFWTLPRHLSGYEVSGWKHPTLRSDGFAGVGMTIEDRRNAAMIRAQAAEDDLAAVQSQHEAALARLQAIEGDLAAVRAERDSASARLDSALLQREAADAIQEMITRLAGQIAELNVAISRKDKSGADQAALHRFVQRFVQTRVLLGLLRRSQAQRKATLHAEAALLGISQSRLSEAAVLNESRAALAIQQGQLAAIKAPDMKIELEQWLAVSREKVGVRKPTLSQPLLGRYFEGLGLSRQAAGVCVTLLTEGGLQAAGREIVYDAVASLPDNRHFAALVERVRCSPWFDEAFYRDLAGLSGTGLQAAIHYLLVGEPLGFSPSSAFNPEYYATRYPDVPDSGMSCLLHYDLSGQSEGRQALPPTAHFHARAELVDPRRENVIVVVHETSRTGAPTLGWNIVRHLAQKYNVYTVRLGEGALTPEFEALSAEVHAPFANSVGRHQADVEFGLRSLFAGRVFKYAIVNSIESRPLLEICARRSVPTLLLMHEFGSYVWPVDSLQKALDLATEIVFPAPIVARSAIDVHPALANRRVHVKPQGMSVIPASKATVQPQSAQLNSLSRARAEGAFIVLGAGSVNLRKGVDLFISVAADVQRLGLERPVHFVWVGGGYRPNEDMGYSVYLKEQLERSGLNERVTFMDEVSDLEPLYAMAHVLLLASRLDPLPNVTIDAAHRGIPIVCFKDASGMADLMLACDSTAIGVVPHLDTHAAAELIGSWASDELARVRIAEAVGQLARQTFDMKHYVEWLDSLGTLSEHSLKSTLMGVPVPKMKDAQSVGRSKTKGRRENFVDPAVALVPERLISVHVPKTAGSSLHSQMAILMGDLVALDVAHDPLTPAGLETAPFPERKRVLHGHFRASRYATTQAYWVTFLRHPIDNLISIYFYWRSIPKPAHELHGRFLHERPSVLELARYPGLQTFWSETYFGGFDMQRFDFIGFHELRDADLPRLGQQIGLPLVAEVHVNRSAHSDERTSLENNVSIRSRLADLLAEDIAFYERWRSRAC
jgi:glycosyltransferase involved in cell wall biosynthesis/predicted O-methyltransferase YrrM